MENIENAFIGDKDSTSLGKWFRVTKEATLNRNGNKNVGKVHIGHQKPLLGNTGYILFVGNFMLSPMENLVIFN